MLTRRPPAVAIAALLALLWLAVAPRTPDLAAAVYRADLFHRSGFELYDSAWYGGHHLLGYSIVAPILGAELGVRLTGALAAVASTFLFEQLARHRWGDRARPAIVWFAVASLTDLLIGRITFGLGMTAALAALLALQRGRPRLAIAAALLSAATSPVACLFLALAGSAVWLHDRRDRRALALTAAALGAVVTLAALFPEGGHQPFGSGGLIAVLLAAGIVGVIARGREPVIAIGAALYCLAGLLAFLAPTPMGSNITRLGAEFAGPVAVGVLVAHRPRLPDLRSAVPIVAALAFLAGWQWFAPIRETSRGIADPSYEARYYRGLLSFVEADAGGRPVRLEIPFTRSHWESVHVAPHVPLARGWQTQLDRKYHRIFFEPQLTVRRYGEWLRRNAVAYVALPDVPLDPGGRREAHLVAAGLPYLEPAWHDDHWRVYRVRDAWPLLSGPGRLRELDGSRMVLDASGPGSLLVRVRWSRYWRASSGACVRRTGADWTRVRVARAGQVVIRSQFTPRAALDGEPRCRRGRPA